MSSNLFFMFTFNSCVEFFHMICCFLTLVLFCGLAHWFQWAFSSVCVQTFTPNVFFTCVCFCAHFLIILFTQHKDSHLFTWKPLFTYVFWNWKYRIVQHKAHVHITVQLCTIISSTYIYCTSKFMTFWHLWCFWNIHASHVLWCVACMYVKDQQDEDEKFPEYIYSVHVSFCKIVTIIP